MPTAKKGKKPANGKRTLTKAAKQAAFLASFSECAIITRAAKQARIDPHQHYEWMDDPVYAQRFAEAHKAANGAIEAEIYRRGHEGVLKPVFYQGKKCSTVREYSDTLLIFYAKKHIPDYRDNYKADINLQANIQADHKIDLTKLSDEQLSSLNALLAVAAGDDPVSGNGGTREAQEDQDGSVLP